MIALQVKFAVWPEFNVKFSGVQVIWEEVEQYAGAYSIRPEVEAQILPTREKKMADDLTVQGIPFHSVINPAQGNTAIIGGVEYNGIQ